MSDLEGTAAVPETASSDSIAVPPSSSSPEAHEAHAFLGWAQAVERSFDDVSFAKPLERVEDLCDGTVLFDVLSSIDAQHFKNPHAGSGDKDNWMVKIGTMKRLHKLIMQYYAEALSATPDFAAPDLDAIVSSASLPDLCALCRLAIGLAVQSERAGEHIAAIQTLPTEDQHALMMAIDVVMKGVKSSSAEVEEPDAPDANGDAPSATGNGDAAIAGTALEATLSKDQEALQKLYSELLDKHTTLQGTLEDVQAERDEAVRDLKRERQERDAEKQSREDDDGLLKAEVQRLKDDLRKSEDHLAEAESEVERLGSERAEMGRKVEDLQRQASDAARLKDQLDEYKHAADKLQKTENVIEKYKKKLEEGADVRKQLRVLEEQNAELVDKNASLEDEYKRVAAFKPLMDSYKSQIAELEAKASNLQRDLNATRYDNEQVTLRLKAMEEERAKEKEELELYRERVDEMEAGSEGKKRRKAATAEANGDAPVDGPEGLAAANDSVEADEDEDGDLDDIGGELDDALSGVTMTGLKIKVRKLARDLETAKANKADVSRILVLENLLDDAQRMKARYEADYLREHQAKLKLQSQLDTIRSGKSDLGDGAEAAYALRLRLNETVEELDQVKRERLELEVKHEETVKELNIAKSDLTLVNKDQIDVLHSLRESVNLEKAGLEKDVTRLRDKLKAEEETTRMQMAQINSLLMEKVDLQSEGIGQREEALKRERNLGELRASLAGKALPKEAEELIVNLQSAAADADKARKSAQDKLEKAKTFIRQQDRMLKERETSGSGASDEELTKANRNLESQLAIAHRELRLMSSAWHDLSHRHQRELQNNARARGRVGLLGSSGAGGGGGAGGGASGGWGGGYASGTGMPASWLAQQRRAMVGALPFARRS